MTTNVHAVLQNNFKVIVERVNTVTGVVEDTKEYAPGVSPVINWFSMSQELRFREVPNETT